MNEAIISPVDGVAFQRDGNAPPGFDLLDEVGRGGMGVVWRARDCALDREVAVKILLDKYAPDSGTAARFLAEARITGQLQHPSIPAVYQVGTLADGRPFLAMKLIKGQTLDELLKAGAAVDPLALVEAIGQAVGYAHAHGVIHRDLKPANVMVGSFGEVQVMDWGLAKVLDTNPTRKRGNETDPEATTAQTQITPPRDSDASFTQYGSVLGTPAYMAPEQAAGELDKVDTRSDVFGLGAILCVLLTGKPPFEGKDAESVRLAAVRGQTAEAFARLDACAADPDVVTLCKRCLAFEPVARPATADEVASQVAALRRAADDRAKQAERDKLSAEVRAAEQVKRRRAVQWAAGIVAAVLLLGVVGTSVGLIWADAARRDAEAAEQAEAEQKGLAQAKEAEANAVVKFFEDKLLAAGRPKGQAGGLGKDVSLRDAIAASLPALDTRFKDQPLVEDRLRRTLGITLSYLGEIQPATEQFERARVIATQLYGPDHRDTLGTMNNLASCYSILGRHADALRLYEETLAARKRVLPPDHPDTLQSLSNLANLYQMLGQYADALKLHEETLAARRRLLRADHPHTLLSMHNLANSYQALGRYDEALKLREDTLAASKRALPPDHPDTIASMHSLSNSFAALGRHADALKLREETLAAHRRVLPLHHLDTLASMHNLANSYQTLGRYDEALKLHEETLAARQRALAPDHPATLTSLWSIAEALVKLNRGSDAVPVIDACISKAIGKVVDPQMIPAVIDLRLRHFQKNADPAGCRASAAMWEKLDRNDSASLYYAACIRAATAGVQAKTRGADAAPLAMEDADKAMAWLTKAVAAGYKDRAHMEKDADLDFLRDRADFQKLLASLPEPSAKRACP